MKHCILVKFNDEVNKEELYGPIEYLFSKCLEIEGISEVRLIKNCIDRDNRYDLLIRIEMDKESLSIYDECEYHKEWKEKYGMYIAKKAIFDYED